MVPRTSFQLSTGFHAITVTENRLCSDRNRLGEVRVRYLRECDAYVARNATYEGQVSTLAKQVTQLLSVGSNADTASGK